LFYDFSLYDEVDDPLVNYGIYACSSFSLDFTKLALESPKTAVAFRKAVDVHFEVGWWDEGFGLASSGVRSVVKQMRKYIDRGHKVAERPFIMFSQSGQATVGLYIGQSLLNKGLAPALKIFEDNLANLNVLTLSLAMQFCTPEYDSTHIFGLIVTSNATLSPI
jgi:hypothetical protein